MKLTSPNLKEKNPKNCAQIVQHSAQTPRLAYKMPKLHKINRIWLERFKPIMLCPKQG